MKIRDELAKENRKRRKENRKENRTQLDTAWKTEKKTGRSSIRLGSIELRPVFFSRLTDVHGKVVKKLLA
jgi:hypothetical protein